MVRASCLAFLAIVARPAWAGADELEAAYLREVAVLKTTAAELERQGAELERAATARTSALAAEIAELEARLLAAGRRADRADVELADGARRAGVDPAERIREALARAGERLGDPPLGEARDLGALIAPTFARLAAAIARGGEVRRGSGRFFLADGVEVEGTVVEVGQVIAYGVSPRGRGALAPAGEGRLRLWEDPAEAEALAFATGTMPGVFSAYLFEGRDRAAPPKRTKTVAGELEKGGPIGVLIVLLGAAGALMLALRAGTLLVAGRGLARTTREIAALVAAGRRHHAARALDGRSGAVARVLRSTLANLDEDPAEIEAVVEEVVLEEATAIERFGTATSVIAAVAPLLGLLGTVTGMITTFDVITELGTGDPRSLSGGIAEALVTTELGLMVAIPMLLFGTLLSARADGLLSGLEHAALSVANLAHGHRRPATPAPAEAALPFGAPAEEAS